MQHLRANTQVIVTVGPFVDVADGFTPQTDITLGGNEAELLKHGSATVVDIAGATWAAVANCRGYYSLTLTTAHTNTEGMLVVVVQDDSDCLPVKAEFMVLSEAAWDSLYAAKDTGFMDVNVKAVSEDTGAADNLKLDYDGTGYTKANSTMPQLVDDIWDEALTGAAHNGATTAGRRLRQANDAVAILHEGTAQAGGATTITLAAGASATNDIYHDGYISILAGTGLGQIRAIIAYDGGTKIATVSKSWAINPASGSEYVIAGSSSVDLHTIQDDTSSVDNLKTACDAYTAAKGLSGTDLATAAADVANIDGAAMRGTDSAALASVCTEGRLGELDGANLPADVDAILADTGTDGVLLAAGATSAQLVDDVWDEDVDTSHQTAGSAGKKLDDAGAAADPWATALPGAYGAGTAGKIIGDNLDAKVGDVEADSQDIQSRLPAALVSGRMSSDVEAINDVVAAAVQLAKSAQGIGGGTVDDTVAPTPTVFESSDFTEATADRLIGRRIVWYGSASMVLEAATVEDYALVSGRGRFTVTEMTAAPINGDPFVIV